MNCMSKKVERNKEKLIQKEYHIFLMSILLMKQEKDIKTKTKNIKNPSSIRGWILFLLK